MDENLIVSLLRDFAYCKVQYQPEFVDGVRVGLKLAYLSALARKPYSRELYGYLLGQSSQIISLRRLKRDLFEMSDIVLNESTFVGGFLNFDEIELNSRQDFINAFRSVYDSSMHAFLEMIEFYRDEKTAAENMRLYFDSMMTLVIGLERKILEVTVT